MNDKFLNTLSFTEFDQLIQNYSYSDNVFPAFYRKLSTPSRLILEKHYLNVYILIIARWRRLLLMFFKL